VEREGRKAFVWHEQSVPASVELLESYSDFARKSRPC
jgi:hypothetical protein